MRARWAVLAAAALFSTGGAAIKLVALPAFDVAAWRSGIAALALFCLWPAARARPRWGELLVACAYAATLTLYVVANQKTTAAQAVFLQATAPIYVLILAPLFLRERLRRADLLFFVALAIGLAILLRSQAAQPSAPDPATGTLFGAAAGAAWALTLLGLRALSQTGRSTAIPVLWGNVFAFLGGAWFAGGLAWPAGSELLPLLWLGVFQIALAYLLLGRGLSRLPALEASLLVLVEPVLSPLWAWLLHAENPGWWSLAGGVWILGATAWRAVAESGQR